MRSPFFTEAVASVPAHLLFGNLVRDESKSVLHVISSLSFWPKVKETGKLKYKTQDKYKYYRYTYSWFKFFHYYYKTIGKNY